LRGRWVPVSTSDVGKDRHAADPGATDTFALNLKPQVSSASLAAAIDAMLECEEATTACAAAMVTEDDVRAMQDAIIRDMNCTDVVGATRRVVSRGSDSALLSSQLEACVMACEHSAEQCVKHAVHHEHCRIARRRPAGAPRRAGRCCGDCTAERRTDS
jgi:hypothetical protein